MQQLDSQGGKFAALNVTQSDKISHIKIRPIFYFFFDISNFLITHEQIRNWIRQCNRLPVQHSFEIFDSIILAFFGLETSKVKQA